MINTNKHSTMRLAKFTLLAAFLVMSIFLAPDVLSSIAHADALSVPEDAMGVRKVSNDIPPRLQWDANFGYCGETAMISAGLYYGQYVSQYDARAIASMNARQSKRGSQLLLGVDKNAAYAAARMHLKAREWKGDEETNASSFLTWVKANVAAGYPVLIGVYENYSKFEDTDDPQYDHIVPVIEISSKHPFSKPTIYYNDDEITFSDNGLWTGDDENGKPSDGTPTYIRQYPFGAFQATRKEADQSRRLYSLPRVGGNNGIVITGIIDHDGKTLPVRVVTNLNDEEPHMPEGSNHRPKPENLVLKVTVSGLKPFVPYNLYRYDSFASVPNSGFNAQASKASKVWKIGISVGSTYSIEECISSDQVAVYRAVPSTAP